jgi:hypothetical protein
MTCDDICCNNTIKFDEIETAIEEAIIKQRKSKDEWR